MLSEDISRMATRFDSKSYAIQQFKVLANKYFPHEYMRVNSGKKGFKLSESTHQLIENSKKVIESAIKESSIVPQSTANIYRYGVTFQRIFNDLSNFQTISSVKSRSRRGYRKEMEFLAFDLKKIELELKKSSNPQIKIHKDKKFLNDTKKRYLELMNEDKVKILHSEVLLNRTVFILDDSEGFKFFDSLFRFITSINQNYEQIEVLKSQKKKEKQSILHNKNRVQKLTSLAAEYQSILRIQKEERGVFHISTRKETLLTDQDVSLFLKIITTSLERYIKMMERREKQRIDQKEEFMNMIVEPTKYEGFNENLWKQIVFIIETHGIELLGSKNWFDFKFPDEVRDFITRKDVLTKFAELRKLESELKLIDIELRKISEFSEAIDALDELELLKNQLINSQDSVPRIDEEVQQLKTEITREKRKIFLLLN
jgi:hypothetical protein